MTEVLEDDIKQEWLLMWGANELRQNELLVDVTLVVEDKKLKPCHRAVLAASSPYFRAMFTHNVAEKTKQEIEIKELDYSSVSAVLDYMYTSKVNINDDNVQDLLTACGILQVIGLYGKCRRYMQRRLTLNNCLEVYTFAKSLCCTELQNDAFALITRKFSDIIGTPRFLNLCKDDLIDFISVDELSVEKEETVYEAVLSWLLHDVSSRGLMVNEVFSHVRLTLLCEDYLNKCIVQEEALQSFEQLMAQVEASQKYKRQMKEQMTRIQDQNEAKAIANENSKSLLEDTQKMENSECMKPQNEQGVSIDENTENLKLNNENDSNGATDSQVNDCPRSFLDFPYYEVNVTTSINPVKIPLTVTPRSGMCKTEVLLFTNGRRTILFNPLDGHYICGNEDNNQTTESEADNKPGVDSNMPIMKNAEICVTQNGMVYLIGGLEVEKSASVTSLRSRVFTFDFEKLKWTPRSSLVEPRAMIGMGETNGKFCVTGGKALSHGRILSSVHVYNDDDNVWSEGPSMPHALYGHGCASVKERMYVIGGKTGDREISGSVVFLDGKTNQWTEASQLQVPRFLSGIAVLRIPTALKKCSYREVIYVVGGVGGEGLLSSVETFNPETDGRWILEEDFPGNRCAQTLTSIGGNICAVGGHVTERSNEGRFESIQKFDVFLFEPVNKDDVNAAKRQWRRLVRHVQGISGSTWACAGIRIDKNRINVSQ